MNPWKDPKAPALDHPLCPEPPANAATVEARAAQLAPIFTKALVRVSDPGAIVGVLDADTVRRLTASLSEALEQCLSVRDDALRGGPAPYVPTCQRCEGTGRVQGTAVDHRLPVRCPSCNGRGRK